MMLATDINNLESVQSNNLITMTLTALRINISSKRSISSSSSSSSISSVFSPVAPEMKKFNNEMLLPEITLKEVSYHDNVYNCWIVLYDRVYDVTEFLDKHPGGGDIILDYAGRDATIAFRGTGHSKIALDQLKDYLIGELPLHERIYRNKFFQLSDIPD